MATVTFKKDTVCNLAGTEINVGDTAPVATVVTVTQCFKMSKSVERVKFN